MSVYVEPKTSQEFLTVEEARERIEELELALVPFASVGIIMSGAKFNLAAVGREREPAGGYWINALDHSVMKATEYLYFKAVDVYGRARVEREYCEAMDKIRVQAEEEKKLKEMPTASATPS